MTNTLHIDDALFHKKLIILLQLVSKTTDENVRLAFTQWELAGCPLVNNDGIKGAVTEDDINQLTTNFLCNRSVKQKVAQAYKVVIALHERNKERNERRQTLILNARRRALSQGSEVVSLSKGDFLRLLTQLSE